jgi:hypothetical protein
MNSYPGNRSPRETLTRLLARVLILACLGACATTSDIDLSKVESKCGQQCSASYSECVSKFSFFPIHEQHVCTDALRLCAQSCPAR